MGESEKNASVSLKDQVKKFVIKGLLGFQSVVVFNIGQKLGIFDYLSTTAKESSGGEAISLVSFTLDELTENLHLDANYLDGWIHMGLVCGLFELDESREKAVKTAPFVYDILVDKTSYFYAGNPLLLFSNIAPVASFILESFHTGQLRSWVDFPEDLFRQAAETSAADGKRMEQLFSSKFKFFAQILRQGGSILDVGCGYGIHISHWAKKYKNCRVVGIDPDPRAAKASQELFAQDQWDTRVTILNMTTAEFIQTNPEPFDLVIMNEVLHELNPDEEYRRSVLNDIYSLLKEAGLLVIHDSIIPDTFTPDQGKVVFEVMHKWLEVTFGSRFYDEAGFQALVASTFFQTAELVREGSVYFWALKK
ncbi:MAG TPA: class I SAM-dependent methyltransferase [Candidatus Lokiarchaeia archaeon]|nr:class I SAM-dependent methyltransferase [Candidatus Lokiarchaeia archaeon]